MSRMRWIAKQDENGFRLIPADEYVPVSQKTSYQVLQDTIADTWHPVTGEKCSSRTGMVKIAKAHGCEEWSPGIKPQQYKPNREEIREKIKHFDSELRQDRRGTLERFQNKMVNGE